MNDDRAMAQEIHFLGRGLDTLIVNVYPTDQEGDVIKERLPEALEQELTRYKERAQLEDEEVPTRWVFQGENLCMKDKGGSHFKWILTCNQFTVAVSRGIKVALWGQVRFSSEYLWKWNSNPSKGISDVLLFLTHIFGADIAFQASEVHIALDFTGWDIGSCQVKDHFIHRAVQTAPVPETVDATVIAGPEQVIERWKRITGLPFGKHSSAVSCLIYDKTHEIKYHCKDKGWFHDLWLAQKNEDGSPAWDGQAPVWRIEFRFKRPALQEFSLENVYEVLDRIPDLWAYAAGHVGGSDGLPDGWLRYVVPAEDTNRSRWPVHPCWQMIQGAFLPSVPASVPVEMQPLQRQCKRKVNMRRALAAIAGYTSTVEAWRRNYADERKRGEPEVEPDISDTFHFLYVNVQAYIEETKRDFSKLVEKKRVLYRLAATAA
ncbi:MAG TPA: hypothetical protein VJ761_07990 [Ktedonobacteraceae bacterium]|nr:hypothetical protein [Ktedonobacteraceae bacterium]